ncbi:MAG: glycine cleavage system protein H [Planctomycetes bacterium]|nr:glycine cleavage system protein H [Planctomycetota bacterium]
MSAGVLAFKLCDRAFECERCPLDLALGAAHSEPARAPRGRLAFPDDRAYTAGHAWVLALDATRVRLGLDAFAARLVERVHALVLPAAGTRVRAGEPLGWLIDEREPIPLAAPVDGVVLAANPRVRAEPGLALAEPYGAGWLVELAREPGARDACYDARFARLAAARDLRALRRLASRRAHDARVGATACVGPTACDGGAPLADLRRVLGARRFQRVLRRLLG